MSRTADRLFQTARSLELNKAKSLNDPRIQSIKDDISTYLKFVRVYMTTIISTSSSWPVVQAGLLSFLLTVALAEINHTQQADLALLMANYLEQNAAPRLSNPPQHGSALDWVKILWALSLILGLHTTISVTMYQQRGTGHAAFRHGWPDRSARCVATWKKSQRAPGYE